MGKKTTTTKNFAYYPYLFLNFLSIVSIWIFCPLTAEMQEPKLHTERCYSLPQKTQHEMLRLFIHGPYSHGGHLMASLASLTGRFSFLAVSSNSKGGLQTGGNHSSIHLYA